MIPVASLWLPILVSAVACFVASSIIHMFLGYHQADYRKVPQEDAVMEALRKFAIPPGDYHMPRPAGRNDLSSPEFREKVKRGPVVMMTVMTGYFAMGKRFLGWFIYLLIVSGFVGCLAARMLAFDALRRPVFDFTALVAFAAYGLALWPLSIWYERSWGTTIRSNIDALIYAVITGGIFAWLWPHV
jgi:hypothetical protein